MIIEYVSTAGIFLTYIVTVPNKETAYYCDLSFVPHLGKLRCHHNFIYRFMIPNIKENICHVTKKKKKKKASAMKSGSQQVQGSPVLHKSSASENLGLGCNSVVDDFRECASACIECITSMEKGVQTW